jgi:dolichol-phosphate mannosyltransferase
VATLRQTRLDNLLSKGYSFQQEVLYRACQAGARVGETPIIFEERRAGSSKVDVREVVGSLSAIVRLAFLARIRGDLFRPLPTGVACKERGSAG